MVSFAELEEDFLRILRETVFCAVTTVGEDGRPRSRILHPVFVVRDGRPLGWALTARTPLKMRHLAANPSRPRSRWGGGPRGWPATARTSGAARCSHLSASSLGG